MNSGASEISPIRRAIFGQSCSLIVPARMWGSRIPASADSSRMVISVLLISSEKITDVMPCLIEHAREKSSASVLFPMAAGGEDHHLLAQTRSVIVYLSHTCRQPKSGQASASGHNVKTQCLLAAFMLSLVPTAAGAATIDFLGLGKAEIVTVAGVRDVRAWAGELNWAWTESPRDWRTPSTHARISAQ